MILVRNIMIPLKKKMLCIKNSNTVVHIYNAQFYLDIFIVSNNDDNLNVVGPQMRTNLVNNSHIWRGDTGRMRNICLWS